MNTERIELTSDERQQCVEYDKKVMSRVHGPNYTKLETMGRFFIGRCGEIAVQKWASALHLSFEETIRDDGIPDKQDFIFHFIDGRNCRANVKTTLHPFGKNIMIPESQWNRHEQDVYIGVNGEDTGVTVSLFLWGVITRKQFINRHKKVSRKIMTMEVPLSCMQYKMDKFSSKILKE